MAMMSNEFWQKFSSVCLTWGMGPCDLEFKQNRKGVWVWARRVSL
jgi:hypothetical protein